MKMGLITNFLKAYIGTDFANPFFMSDSIFVTSTSLEHRCSVLVGDVIVYKNDPPP